MIAVLPILPKQIQMTCCHQFGRSTILCVGGVIQCFLPFTCELTHLQNQSGLTKNSEKQVKQS
uniref:Uncharacterized protein n=1 Tax=Anguilla anguilla TaxID=7936 RepID=A0A0E9W813_ANGAN